MSCSRAFRPAWLAVLAVGASASVLAAGCTRERQPPVPTTTTAPPATTVAAPDHGAADDKGWSALSNGHEHATAPVPLDAASQRELDRQLALTQQLVARYPTVAAAEVAGYRRGGPFTPGLGTHYFRFADALSMFTTGATGLTDAQILHPILIFDGVGPDARLAGFMYMAMVLGGSAGAQLPGFAGPNDHWHYHTNICLVPSPTGVEVPLGADQDITKEMCDARGGTMLPVSGYMLHVWAVPGRENPDGLFAELHPGLTCRDGTYHTIPMDRLGANTTACRDEAVPDG